MADDPIAARYAQALFETAQSADQLDRTLEELRLIGRLLREHPELRQLLFNPDVDPQDKVGIVDRLVHGAWSELVRAFIHMVVSMGRSEVLPDIVESFAGLVDIARNRLRVIVRSAHHVPEPVLVRLRTRLERQERKSIELRAEVEPELIGGLQVVLGHRVIDGSVQRQLSDLRERLSAVRVH